MALPTTSFTSPGFDYGADQAQIERRRALASALQGQAMSPMEQQPVAPGQFAVPISPFQGAAKIMQAYAAKRQGDKADQQQRDLAAKAQSDYQKMVARGLRQLQGTPATPLSEDASGNVTPTQPAGAPDPAGAMATFGSHPMGQALQPMAMQELQRQRLIEALRGGQGGAQASAGGTAAPAYGSPGFAPSGAGGQQGSGPNMNLHLLTDPTGKSLVSAMEKQSQTQGRVSYDQNGNAFTVGGDGRVIPLPGIKARDKMTPINVGGSTQFVNEYSPPPGGIEHSIPPAQAAQGRWEGWLPPQQPVPQQPSALRPAPGPVPSAAPLPQAAPANAPLNVPPKDRAKLEMERPQATFAAKSVLDGLGRAEQQIDKLLQAPGLSNITGPVAGRTPNLTGSATNAQSLMDSLKSMISVQELQRMRDASKTGGAVGNVTEKEWPRLEAQWGALQQAQTTDEFKKRLGDVRETMRRMQSNARQAYETTYGKLDYKGRSDDDPLGLR